MHPKRSGNSGRYFRVRNWLSEYGLSFETCGRLCVLVTPRSASKNATGLDLIDHAGTDEEMLFWEGGVAETATMALWIIKAMVIIMAK